LKAGKHLKQRIRAVFADIDGTIYSHGTGSVPSSAPEAIRHAREKGILVFAATGRHILELEDMDIHLDLDGWITLNGALCFNEREVYSSYPLERRDLEALLETIHEHPFACQFLEKDFMYINLMDERVKKSLESIHSPYPQILNPERCLSHETYMLVPWAGDEIWLKAAGKMKAVKYTRWNDLAADAMSLYAGKKQGVLDTCRHYGIDPAETCAIGDGPNDLSLFEACGLKIAMGNAVDELKKYADASVSGIDEDGFAEAFEKYIF
jgi:Cof subfamily protein (haloacid dehalogenase superfamily)